MTPPAAVTVAWLITSIYYFYQYVMRSAPAVMVPEMSQGLWADAGRRRLTDRAILLRLCAVQPGGGRGDGPAGSAQGHAAGRGNRCGRCAALCDRRSHLASIGRFMQGAGGVFALIGAAYIATTYFPASRAATLIGATQMFGMAGGSAGQFMVGPAMAGGLAWDSFWLLMGVVGFPIAILLFLFIPKREPDPGRPKRRATTG